jgi:HEPN domain-containing protein
MSTIREIQQQVKRSYEAAHEPGTNVLVSVQARQWLAFAQEYATAARLVAKHEDLMLPRLQLTGHALELSLKACLAALGSMPPPEHDLVALYELIESHGFHLSEFEQVAVVHLAHFYHRDLATSTKYKTRYPASTNERLGGAMPKHSTYAQLVQSLCEQAERALTQHFPDEGPQ